jgi:hypothetical protein
MGKAVMAGMVVGSMAGGYLPLLWGDSAFSMSAVIMSGVGGLLGILIAYKVVSRFQ